MPWAVIGFCQRCGNPIHGDTETPWMRTWCGCISAPVAVAPVNYGAPAMYQMPPGVFTSPPPYPMPLFQPMPYTPPGSTTVPPHIPVYQPPSSTAPLPSFHMPPPVTMFVTPSGAPAPWAPPPTPPQPPTGGKFSPWHDRLTIEFDEKKGEVVVRPGINASPEFSARVAQIFRDGKVSFVAPPDEKKPG